MKSPSALQWLSLVALLWLQSINGTNMNFPAFSSHLKSVLGLSQLQLNNLAFASDAGKLAGFISGVAALYLPLWLVLLLGSSLGLVGYGFQYLFLAHRFPPLSYLQIFSLTVLAGNSICWINTVCYIVVIQNFPNNRQVAVGLTTSYLGLSAKIYTVIADAVFPSSPISRDNSYLLLNAVVPLAVCIWVSPVVRGFEPSGKFGSKAGTEICFLSMFVITLITGIYAVTSSLLPMNSMINATGISLLLLAPLVVPLGAKAKELIVATKRIQQDLRVYDEESTVESGVSSTKEEGDEVADCEDFGCGVAAKEEIGAKEMVQRVDFWLYFFVYLFGATSGLVFLNNLGQIAESRGCPATSSLVALSSSFGFFGRLIPSFMDYFKRIESMMSRPAMVVAWMVPMAASFFLLLNPAQVSLYISTAMIGVCTGAITSLSVSLTSELFGTKNFGVNHNVVVANIPIGSLVFGNMAAYLYYKHGSGKAGTCMGPDCYRTSFLVWGCLCSLGTLMALALQARTRGYYSRRSGTSSHSNQTSIRATNTDADEDKSPTGDLT